MPNPASTPAFPGLPDVRVRMRRRAHQWHGPLNNNFDIDAAQVINRLGVENLDKNNAYYFPEANAIMVDPLFANRNNFVFGFPTEQPEESEEEQNAPDRFTVSVPKGAPPETQNEINKRVWEALPTINQDPNSKFKKSDVEFLSPGAQPDPNIEDQREKSPQWRDEFEFSENNPDPEAQKAPPVSWIHQQNATPNVEWYIQQKYGNFTNEPWWIDFRNFKSEAISGLPNDETAENSTNNRLDRYRRGKPLGNYVAFRLGATHNGDVQFPGSRCLDVVFPVGEFPFIYDHGGEGLTPPDESEDPQSPPQPEGEYYYQGYTPSVKQSQNWILRNTNTNEFRLEFWVVRGRLFIRNSLAPGDTWVFPDQITTAPNFVTQARYENFFIPACKITIMGRGIKFMYNFNPMEFDIYGSNGRERMLKEGSSEPKHAKIEYPPMAVREVYGVVPEGEENEGQPRTVGEFIDMSNTPEINPQNYTIISFEGETSNVDGESVESAYGFDFVVPRYPWEPIASASYTSMMIPVPSTIVSVSGENNENVVADVDKEALARLVETRFREPVEIEGGKIEIDGGVLSGFNTTISGIRPTIYKNKILQVFLTCQRPTVGEYTGDEDGGIISKRFASPIYWRVKGKQEVPPPPASSRIDITPFVKKITYNTSMPDFGSVEMSYNLELFIPKDFQFDGSDSIYTAYSSLDERINTRQKLLDELRVVQEVEIELGWYGEDRYLDPANDFNLVESEETDEDNPSNFNADGIWVASTGPPNSGKNNRHLVRVFTGITDDFPLQTTFGQDTVNLRILEKTHILKNFLILNSPIFDGMLVSTAFRELSNLGGFDFESSFRIPQGSASFQRVLPMGFTFQEPELKFPDNTTLYDAFKRILGIFQNVLRTDPDGKIVLADLYNNQNNPLGSGSLDVIDDLALTHPDFVFYENPDDQPPEPQVQTNTGLTMRKNPFKTAYETVSSNTQFGSISNQIILQFTDRTDGSVNWDANYVDVNAIENVTAKNFTGYKKILFNSQGAFGEESYARAFAKKLARHAFQSPLELQFTTFGRSILRPLDIIDFVHQNNITSVVRDGDTASFQSQKRIRYRVEEVSGEISLTDRPYNWKMTVRAVKL